MRSAKIIVSDLNLQNTVNHLCSLKNLNFNLFLLLPLNHTTSNSLNLSNSLIMNEPPDTTDPNSTQTNASIDPSKILNWTAEQTDLLTFVEDFSLLSTNFRRPRPRPPLRSRQMGRISRIDQTRQHTRTREWAIRTRFVAARTNSRKESRGQLLEAMRLFSLSKSEKLNTAAEIGVIAVNGGNPILSRSKKEIVGLPGFFVADLLAELNEEDWFLGP